MSQTSARTPLTEKSQWSRACPGGKMLTAGNVHGKQPLFDSQFPAGEPVGAGGAQLPAPPDDILRGGSAPH